MATLQLVRGRGLLPQGEAEGALGAPTWRPGISHFGTLVLRPDLALLQLVDWQDTIGVMRPSVVIKRPLMGTGRSPSVGR